MQVCSPRSNPLVTATLHSARYLQDSYTNEMPFKRPAAVEAIVSNPVRSRDDLVHLLRDLLKPVQNGMSDGHGHVRLGYTGTHFDHRAAEMEGFARALWGLAPLLSAEPDHPDFQSMAKDWVDGLDHGTDPEHEDYWGEPSIRDQRHVEMAAIVGFGSRICRPRRSHAYNRRWGCCSRQSRCGSL